MTVVVGYAPGPRSSGALELASAIAQARSEDLLVVTVIPPRWNIPSMARHTDGEFGEWSVKQGEETLAAAKAQLTEIGCTAQVDYRRVDHRSPGTALMEVADEVEARVAVIGSSEDGRKGHVFLGSTGDRMLHSARIPVAIAPRGYAGPGDDFSGISCAVAGRDDDLPVIAASSTLATEAGVPLRLVTFAVRLGTMYTSNVGFDAEDEIAATARDQAEAYFQGLRKSGAIGDDVETAVGVGHGWRAAMQSIPWDDGDILFIGSHPTDVLTRVFLGSSATKIVRHAPVPVVVLPA